MRIIGYIGREYFPDNNSVLYQIHVEVRPGGRPVMLYQVWRDGRAAREVLDAWRLGRKGPHQYPVRGDTMERARRHGRRLAEARRRWIHEIEADHVW